MGSGNLVVAKSKIENAIKAKGEACHDGFRIKQTTLSAYLNKDAEYIKARRGKGKTSHIIEKYFSQEIETMTIGNDLWYHWKNISNSPNVISPPPPPPITESSTTADRFKPELEKMIKAHGAPTIDGYKIRFSILGSILKSNPTFQELRKGNGKPRETIIKLYGDNVTFKEMGASDWMYWHPETQTKMEDYDKTETSVKEEKQMMEASPLLVHMRADDLQQMMDDITVDQAIRLYHAVREYGVTWTENEKKNINLFLQGMIPTDSCSSIIDKLLLLQKIIDDDAINNSVTKKLLENLPVDKLLSSLKKKIDDFSLIEMSTQLNIMMDDVCSAIKETMPFVLSSPEVISFYDLINRTGTDMDNNLLTLHRCYKKIKTMSMWLNAECDWSMTSTDEEVFRSFGLTTPFMYNGIRNYWDKDNEHLKDYLIHEKRYLEVYEWRSGYKKDGNSEVETRVSEERNGDLQPMVYSEGEEQDQIETIKSDPLPSVVNPSVTVNTAEDKTTGASNDEIDALKDLLSF